MMLTWTSKLANICLAIIIGFCLILAGFIVSDPNNLGKYLLEAQISFAITLGILGIGLLWFTTRYTYYFGFHKKTTGNASYRFHKVLLAIAAGSSLILAGLTISNFALQTPQLKNGEYLFSVLALSLTVLAIGFLWHATWYKYRIRQQDKQAIAPHANMLAVNNTLNICISIMMIFACILASMVMLAWARDVMSLRLFWTLIPQAIGNTLGILGVGTLLNTTYYIYSRYHKSDWL